MPGDVKPTYSRRQADADMPSWPPYRSAVVWTSEYAVLCSVDRNKQQQAGKYHAY